MMTAAMSGEDVGAGCGPRSLSARGRPSLMMDVLTTASDTVSDFLQEDVTAACHLRQWYAREWVAGRGISRETAEYHEGKRSLATETRAMAVDHNYYVASQASETTLDDSTIVNISGEDEEMDSNDDDQDSLGDISGVYLLTADSDEEADDEATPAPKFPWIQRAISRCFDTYPLDGATTATLPTPPMSFTVTPSPADSDVAFDLTSGVAQVPPATPSSPDRSALSSGRSFSTPFNRSRSELDDSCDDIFSQAYWSTSSDNTQPGKYKTVAVNTDFSLLNTDLSPIAKVLAASHVEVSTDIGSIGTPAPLPASTPGPAASQAAYTGCSRTDGVTSSAAVRPPRQPDFYYNPGQRSLLMGAYGANPYCDSSTRNQLANILNLHPNDVMRYFKNSRRRFYRLRRRITSEADPTYRMSLKELLAAPETAEHARYLLNERHLMDMKRPTFWKDRAVVSILKPLAQTQ